MTRDHENLHADTGTPEPPLPPTDMGILWEELTRTNGMITQLQRMIYNGLNSLAGDLGAVEKKVKAFEAYTAEDRQERQERRTHLDRLLWAGLALAAAHLALDAVRLWRARQS